MGCTVVLALVVGLAVTSQTLYAAAVASLREYAVLDALGIPRWRLAALVLATSFWTSPPAPWIGCTAGKSSICWPRPRAGTGPRFWSPPTTPASSHTPTASSIWRTAASRRRNGRRGLPQ